MNKPTALAVMLLFSVLPVCASSNYCLTSNDINIRADSTVGSSVLGTLSENDTVEVIDQSFEWYKIVLPKRLSGYVWANYVTQRQKMKGMVVASRLNIRQQPSLDAPVMGQIPDGTLVTVRKTVGDWLEIIPHPWATGWVHKKFLHPCPAETIKTHEIFSHEPLTNFVAQSLEALAAASDKESQAILDGLFKKGKHIITLLDAALDPQNEKLTYDIISLFTRFGREDPALISYFLRKSQSRSPVIASIYLDVVQNILSSNTEKIPYYYLTKQEKISGDDIQKIREQYQRIHRENILKRGGPGK